MSWPVQLYVYDLSNGLARQLSMQLTGRQIDGIWHTSIVVFGKEIFYGQGIDITLPGKSHHGSPLQTVQLGQTSIDEETFNEYLEDLRESYTAEKYHLLDFNCNSFTNDVAGFLTGCSIPDYIKGMLACLFLRPKSGRVLPPADLPTDFLSTPFGAALRPTIDAMYQRPTAGAPQPLSAPSQDLASSIVEAVAARASSSSSSGMQTPLPATQSLTGSIHVCGNLASLQSILQSHKAVVALFTNIQTCYPCRMIAPVYEEIASSKSRPGAAFVKIDMSTQGGHSVSEAFGVRSMPTFKFFLDGTQISEVKGADPPELRTQVDLLLFQAFPPHPHTSVSLPAFEAMSLKPILFTQVPALDTVSSKLSGFVDSSTWNSQASQSKDEVKQTLIGTVIPYLKSRYPPSGQANPPSATPTIIQAWSQLTQTLASTLPMELLFPLVDMWRLALLDPAFGAWSASNSEPIATLVSKETSGTTAPRPYLLTLLRMLSNGFSSTALAQKLLVKDRNAVTALVIPSLLHDDAGVRTAAASLTFTISSFLQKLRIEKVKNLGTGTAYEDEDWEVEIVSAVVEAVKRDTENEEVVHRLVASLGCLLRLSPYYDAQVNSLLEILQARTILKSKLEAGGCGANGVMKKDVRKLIEEIATRLCP